MHSPEEIRFPPVYVVIVNYRRWQDTQECLESVFRSAYSDYRVMIIDNHSGNDSLEHLSGWLKENPAAGRRPGDEGPGYMLVTKKELVESWPVCRLPRVTLIQNDENKGFAAGNNVALNHLRNENAWFWLLNPDMVIMPDTLEKLVACAKTLPLKSIVGTVVQSHSGNHDVLFYGGHKINFYSATVSMVTTPGSVNRIDYISGASLFSHASNLNELGLLPEEYFLYWEETDWCYRAKQAGFVLSVCPGAICYDKVSTIIGKSFMSDYYYARNGLRFISKFRKKNIPFVLFFMSIRFLKRVVTGEWARARGVLKGTVDFFKLKKDEVQ